MFTTKILAQGLPYPDGTVRDAQTTFEFSFCLAESNGNRWLMGIDAIREDRVTYLPVSEAQGIWIDQQADLMIGAGMELSWWFRDAHAAFEFVERLGACRIGPSLQERFTAEGGDIIAPPPASAEAMLDRALAALDANHNAQAFDLASRLLAGEGFRGRARQIRERVLARFGCVDDAQRERDIIALLGDTVPLPTETTATSPALVSGYRAVAIELQGLPLDYPAVENFLVRYLYRVDVPHASVTAPCWIRMPMRADSALQAELPEQVAWLARTGATLTDGNWTFAGEAGHDAFISAIQNGLACTDRWGIMNRIRAVQTGC